MGLLAPVRLILVGARSMLRSDSIMAAAGLSLPFFASVSSAAVHSHDGHTHLYCPSFRLSCKPLFTTQ